MAATDPKPQQSLRFLGVFVVTYSTNCPQLVVVVVLLRPHATKKSKSNSSALAKLPRPRITAARLLIELSVSGCSSPKVLRRASTASTCKFSGLCLMRIARHTPGTPKAHPKQAQAHPRHTQAYARHTQAHARHTQAYPRHTPGTPKAHPSTPQAHPKHTPSPPQAHPKHTPSTPQAHPRHTHYSTPQAHLMQPLRSPSGSQLRPKKALEGPQELVTQRGWLGHSFFETVLQPQEAALLCITECHHLDPALRRMDMPTGW